MFNLFKRKKVAVKKNDDKRSARQWMLDQITFYDVESILEIGVRTGKTVLDLATRLPYCSISGIDLDAKCIEAASKLIEENKMTNRIQLQVSKTEEIPFNPAMFSKVIAFDVYSLWDKPSISLFEIRRVLKVDGKVYFYMSSSEQKSGKTKLPTTDELIELLERTGFSNISVKEHNVSSKLQGVCIRGKKED